MRNAILTAFLMFALPPLAGAQEIELLSPPMIANAGLKDLESDYAKKTGESFSTKITEIGKLLDSAKTSVPPPDIIFLPTEMMGELDSQGGIRAGTRTPLGRMEIGLAVRAGAPHPDISTLAKLVRVLKGAQAVVYSNPATGSMEAKMIDQLLNRPEFAGVHRRISTKGNGISALARGEGDVALQLVCEILDRPGTELVGPLPRELGAHIDAEVGVLSAAQHPKEAADFIHYITQPQATAVWASKGLVRP